MGRACFTFGRMADKPRVEILFRKGKPVAACFHLHADVEQGARRTIPIRPPLTALYDVAGRAVGLELPLPTTLSVAVINEVLRELGGGEIAEADLVSMRAP